VRITTRLTPNSRMTCLQLPHGVQRSPSRQTTATTSIRRAPAAAAVVIALVSAHTDAPKAEFSMFAPLITSPVSVTMAAPTLNFEYGEYDSSAAAAARSRSV